ncbi:DNA-binding response regulator [Paenibacillus thermoaerophilus]|uniref:DNA-binding response regulator n=1 Tax=Paenibacillus thermoaerophilus TaxID=1215385 RepID=A0ABW2V9W8_9BACL|nr:MarR family transcriptional regulator [Paenibacillus thermoaerophilus]TMV06653.1 MarR family transcriptional regulator [Paenibacillus thermoaerophilus]
MLTLYEEWLARHLEMRSGERRRRLMEGHSHAERMFAQQVWWPVLRSFDDLHPEYEVKDYKDGSRYLDFAFLRPPYDVAIEIDGYGPHARDMSRRQFSDQLSRQNQLILDDWKVLRFSYDDIAERPRQCQQVIQQMLGKWYGVGSSALPLREREVIRRARRLNRPFAVAEVCQWLGVEQQTARKILKELLANGYVSADPELKRIRRYRLGGAAESLYRD